MAEGALQLSVRQATADDYDDVAAFTAETWSERGSSDYIHRIYHDWIEGDGHDQRTFAVELADGPDAGRVVGIAQAVLLTPYEAWFQGMRVDAEFRRQGVSTALNERCFEWAEDRGATVARIMVFSWNRAALGAARTQGFEPVTEFRWLQPTPDANADIAGERVEDPDAAWSYWTTSSARDHLRGMTLDREESWATSGLTRGDLHAAATETRVLAIEGGADGPGVNAMSFRVREYEREDDDGESEHWVEYGVAAWESVDALGDLCGAIARDAAELGADRTRVLIPETARHVSDGAMVADISDEPDFVLGADLTGR